MCRGCLTGSTVLGIGCFTLGDGLETTGVIVVTTFVTLDDGSGWDVGSTLGDRAETGLSVALFKIWASCM